MIQENILELVKYGLSTGLVDPEDKVYTINRLLELFQVDEIEDAVFEKGGKSSGMDTGRGRRKT